ncbi:MAG: DegT/DnrJ/EryC1/StrS family aminotransferase [Abditibacteriota bacterium]|nr:DegT/DnrJ/EryC1/StrS family aminotransferase [Abditibacteriota bacterium]MBP5718423.1 DegT/DnrJ/EryC1/StrS family aminotransferase [Abditibacteriota bacterium]
MSDKPIYVTRSSMPTWEEFAEEIREIWDTHQLTNMGPKHERLERELESFLGMNCVSLFTNGHLALEAGITALGLTGEVITTPFTFASTTHAIVRCGLTPVFCDIKPDDYTLDPDKIEDLITDKTSAIMPVHVYGNICDFKKIEAIAEKHGLKVFYDAAHAFAEKVEGRSVAALGDMSMFSFHATKVFNTVEGGALAYNDESLRPIVKGLKNFGITGPETVPYLGGNAKMDEFRAAMGLCNMRHLSEHIAKRKVLTEIYRERLSGIEGIKLNPVREDTESNYAYFPVVFDGFKLSRNEVFDALAEKNVFARKYFYPLTNTFECYKGVFNADNTPVALRIADNVMTLPLFSDLEPEDVHRVCDIIASL